MKIYFFLFYPLFIFLYAQASAQKILSTQHLSQADLKVYVVKYESQSDLKIFKVDFESQATDNKGLWYFVSYPSRADKKIFFVDNISQADLKIYFVKYRSQAGWRNKSKMHLMF